MDSKLSHCLKRKVTQLEPAMFADSMVTLIMDAHDIPWDLTFTTEECHDEFFNTFGADIVIYIEDIICPWYEAEKYSPDLWLVNEEVLSKFLYSMKTRFCRKSDEDAKDHFLNYCAAMIYVALEYYKKGVKSAPTTVFLEVYSLACYYSERTNFKCDLISASSEF